MTIEMPSQEVELKEEDMEEQEYLEDQKEMKEKDKIVDVKTEENLNQLLENNFEKNKNQFEKPAKQFEENILAQSSEKNGYLDYSLREGTEKLFQKLGAFFKNEKTENEKISQENSEKEKTIGQKINFPGA